MTSSDRADLRTALIEALEPVTANCHAQHRGLAWEDVVRVSDFDVAQAAWCQASVAGPPEPFVPDIFKTYKAIALRAAKHLTGGSTPTALVSTVMQDLQSSQDWLGDYVRAAPASVRIQTATRAISWLTRTTELLGTDDLTHYRCDQNLEWKYPGYGLQLKTKVPFVRSDHGLSVPVLVTTSPYTSWDDSVAFSMLLWALAVQRSADHAVIIVHSTGERSEIQIDALLERGIGVAAHAALAVSQRDSGPEGLQRTPVFFTCQSCAWHDSCTERSESASGPPVRGGIRLG
jgi:hypothetical protein